MARKSMFTLALYIGFTGLLMLGQSACDQAAPPPAPPEGGAQTARVGGAKSRPGPLTTFQAPAMDYRGLAVQVQSGWKPVEQFGPLFPEIAELGANTVLFATAGFMENAESQKIFLEARKLPAAEDFKQLVREAKKSGLKVIIMPIVLLAKPRGSEWRGVIKPPDWDDWWSQYREFIIYFCEIAREGGADALMVGSELVSTEKQTQRWEEVIATAREHFYGGQLGYSANWDHYKPIQFWDKLDFIGMTTYYTLADKPNASVEDIVERWQPIKEEILEWQAGIGKPLLFTEVGWCSQEGAATAPWNYYHNQKASVAGLEEQRRLYDAFIEAWGDVPSVLGVIWWEWIAGQGGPGDYGYCPRGKPAETRLRAWFEKFEDAPEPAAQEAHGAGAGTP